MSNEAVTVIWILTVFVGTLIAFAVVVLVLFIPAIIAFRRQHPNRWLILAVCAFLGGTGIGWAVALVWALRAAHLPNDGARSVGGESGLNLFANDVKRVMVSSSDNGNLGAPSDGKSTAVDDALMRLERLEKLRAAGQIDESEFQRLRAAALSGL